MNSTSHDARETLDEKNSDTPPSDGAPTDARRQLLRRGLMGTAAAVTVAALAKVTASPARALDGDPLICGSGSNGATSRTDLTRFGPPNPLSAEAFFVYNDGQQIPSGRFVCAVRGASAFYDGAIGVQGQVDGANNGVGVRGAAHEVSPGPFTGGIGVYGLSASSGGGTGVFGRATNGNGVAGESSSGTDPGVRGTNIGRGPGVIGSTTSDLPDVPGVLGANTGVSNIGGGPGVRGTSTSGDGVVGEGKNGVHGVSNSTTDAAVLGENVGAGYGVLASSASGTGLLARSAAVNGVALQLQGLIRVQGNAVGSATMLLGTSVVTVNNLAVTPNSVILITPMRPVPSQLYVTGGVAGSFTISTSGGAPVASDVPIVYLIIN